MGYAGMNPKESFMKRGTGPLERMAMFTSIITVEVARGEEKPRGWILLWDDFFPEDTGSAGRAGMSAGIVQVGVKMLLDGKSDSF